MRLLALDSATSWGLALGKREVAIRKAAITGVPTAGHWRFEGLPRRWAEVDAEAVACEAGFGGAAIAGRPWQTKG
eukprot:13384226-Alexandrium_andersonii.AAC.1